MTTKKKTQKRAAGKPAPAGIARENLAELIAAVLAHPDLPDPIEEGITDGMCEMWNSTELWQDPRAIAACLDHYAGRKARKGGAW